MGSVVGTFVRTGDPDVPRRGALRAFVAQLLQAAHPLRVGQRFDGGILGESVYSFAKSMVHAHAAFAVDWAQAVDGSGRPALGHRLSLMDYDGSRPFSQVGIAVKQASTWLPSPIPRIASA